MFGLQSLQVVEHDMLKRMSWHDKTIETYDQSAEKLAEYFQGIGSRVKYIVKALDLAGSTADVKVVEIGCGDGRDAAEIVDRVDWYEGFDPSKKLLELAHDRLPNVRFVEADALSYAYPNNIDVAFAFASLLHVNKSEMPNVFQKLDEALRIGGIVFASFKERNEYVKEAKIDEYGERMFYYYTPELIATLAGPAFKAVFEDHQETGNTKWFTIALQKI